MDRGKNREGRRRVLEKGGGPGKSRFRLESQSDGAWPLPLLVRGIAPQRMRLRRTGTHIHLARVEGTRNQVVAAGLWAMPCLGPTGNIEKHCVAPPRSAIALPHRLAAVATRHMAKMVFDSGSRSSGPVESGALESEWEPGPDMRLPASLPGTRTPSCTSLGLASGGRVGGSCRSHLRSAECSWSKSDSSSA
jgi:hypothetical protein